MYQYTVINKSFGSSTLSKSSDPYSFGLYEHGLWVYFGADTGKVRPLHCNIASVGHIDTNCIFSFNPDI